MKWIFFAYVALVMLVLAGIGVSFAITPPRNPHTMYTAYGANIKTLDPAEINDVEGDRIAGNIYECLYNYKYGVVPYELFPELAAAMPKSSADGLTLTIPIRHGIKFYDPAKYVFADGVGPEIRAGDFVYSWKRVADFHLASPNYSGIFQGRIVGLDEWWEYTQKTRPADIDWDRPVAGLIALDDYTIQIKLTQPYAQLPFNLAHSPTAVVCRAAVTKYGDQFRKHPIGSGAYILAEHLPEQRILLTANPIYRGRPDVEGGAVVAEADRLPRIKRVEMDYFSEPLPVWLLFNQGLFDIGGIPKDSFNQAINLSTGDLSDEMRRKGIILDKSPEQACYYAGFNMTDPMLGKNKPLRQAMSMAFDRTKYISVFLNGRGQPAIGIIPPGFPTYDAKYVNPYTQFNLDAARAKMREAEALNKGPIPPITIYFADSDTAARQEAEFFSSQMAQIGISLNPQYTTWARFQELMDGRQVPMFAGSGWVADYPDEQTFLQLFYGKNAGPGGINPTAYANPEYDALYEKALTMNPSPERDAIYRRMQQMIMEDCPVLLQMYPLTYTLYYGWVKNLFPMDYGYGMKMYQGLDESERIHGRGRG